MRYRRLAALAPVALVAAGGCFASKGDMRLLQDELRSLRSSVAQADTARRAQADTLLQVIGRANDSLRVLSARFNAFQGNTATELRSMGSQLITIQELTGQSQRRIQELRASMEAQAEAAAAAAPVTDSTKPPVGPGPAQLFQSSLDQLRRGSYGTAREGFQQLLTQYPDYEDAAAAQLYVGETFIQERNQAAADSVYQLVAQRFPRSAQAPTALYKRALLLRDGGRAQEARTLLQRVVRDYPRSDEAQLAHDLLAPKK